MISTISKEELADLDRLVWDAGLDEVQEIVDELNWIPVSRRQAIYLIKYKSGCTKGIAEVVHELYLQLRVRLIKLSLQEKEESNE